MSTWSLSGHVALGKVRIGELLECGELGIQESEMKLLHFFSASFQIYKDVSVTVEFRVTWKNGFGCAGGSAHPSKNPEMVISLIKFQM